VVEEAQHQEHQYLLPFLIQMLIMAENELNTNALVDRSNATPMVTAIEEVETISYQHLHIAAPKPNQKTMKDFCAMYKIPRAAKLNEENNVNNINEGNNNINDTVGGGAATARSAMDEEPMEAKKDNRSGPLVEIEIVIK
jgi:hypothetical protein